MKRLLIGSFFLLCAAALSPAQVAEFGMFAGTNNTSNNQVGTLTADPTTGQVAVAGNWKFGFRITLNSWRFFGNEFGYAYNRAQLQVPGSPDQGMAIHQGFYDFLVYARPEGSRIRPFAAGGVQFNNYVPPGSSAASGGGSTKFGFNYGGGLKFKISSMFLIRFDVRQYQSGKPFGLPNAPGGMFRQTEVSSGFSLTL
jgi:opacity protein-like surface antigen